ncbi:MAG: hypothetical protein WKF84_01570 [Pyrinomonadaceae bacterium]
MQASAEKKKAVSSRRRENGHETKPYEFADLSAYSLKQRLLIRAADRVFYLLIGLIGGTTRFEVEGSEYFASVKSSGHIPIYASWHNRVLLATYFFRHRRIVVMTSRKF